MTAIGGPSEGVVTCDYCDQLHPAEYDHPGSFGEGPIYAVSVVSCSKPALWLREDGTPFDVYYVTKEGLWYL